MIPLILFEIFNFIDWMGTSVFVIYGPISEGNPIMDYVIQNTGMPGFTIAKLIAAATAFLLYKEHSKYIWIPVVFYAPIVYIHSYLLVELYLT